MMVARSGSGLFQKRHKPGIGGTDCNRAASGGELTEGKYAPACGINEKSPFRLKRKGLLYTLSLLVLGLRGRSTKIHGKSTVIAFFYLAMLRFKAADVFIQSL